MDRYREKFSLLSLLFFFGVWREALMEYDFLGLFFFNLMNFFVNRGIGYTNESWELREAVLFFLLRIIINGLRSEFGEYRTIGAPPPALFWLENVFHFFLNMKGVTSNDFENWGNNKLMNLIQYHFGYHLGFGI